jgi:hypothetical protein
MVADPVKSGCQFLIGRDIPVTAFFIVDLIKSHCSEHSYVNDAFIIAFPTTVVDTTMPSAVSLEKNAFAFGTFNIPFGLIFCVLQRLKELVTDVRLKIFKHRNSPRF